MVWDPSLCYDASSKRSASHSVSLSDMLDLEPLVAEGPVAKKVRFLSLAPAPTAPTSPPTVVTSYDLLPTMTFEELFGGSSSSDAVLSNVFDNLLVTDSVAPPTRRTPSPPPPPRSSSTPSPSLPDMVPLLLPESYYDVAETKRLSEIRHAGLLRAEGGVVKWMQTLARD